MRSQFCAAQLSGVIGRDKKRRGRDSVRERNEKRRGAFGDKSAVLLRRWEKSRSDVDPVEF
jgi:hypothetical protein